MESAVYPRLRLNSPLSFFFTGTFLSRTYCGMPFL